MPRRTKLELTWIGKENRPRLEPRILLDEPEHAHHAATRKPGDHFDNLLIHGDNLLALKALEAEYTGKVKCVYIDPPFNTGEAFEYYDDGVEHSVWLSLMRNRLEILYNLLSKEGTLFAHIDDNELAYLVVLIDEIFGRENRISIITFKQSSVSGPKSQNPGVVSTSSYVLYYCKDKSSWNPGRARVPRDRDTRYNHYITNFEKPYQEWEFITLREVIGDQLGMNSRSLPANLGRMAGASLGLSNENQVKLGNSIVDKLMNDLVLSNPERVIQPASVKPKDVNAEARDALMKSIQDPDKFYRSERKGLDDYYFKNGKQILFYSNKTENINGANVTVQSASTIWDDLLSNNLHKEGGVSFPKGKKPEGLLERLLTIATDPGDLVLDSFAGSGTTGAVAHKMGRRWIMVELGEHAYTHIVPRMKKVVDGADAGGVTESTGWTGGGGFRVARLAPSLLRRDDWGEWVINPDYHPEALAEALCKHEGFRYEPSETAYWMHGRSTETDFLYVTTQTLTADRLRSLSESVGSERTLLVLCSAWRGDPERYPNLTLKKIPSAVLDRCEWGRDDYSLTIADLPEAAPGEDTAADEPAEPGEGTPLFSGVEP